MHDLRTNTTVGHTGIARLCLAQWCYRTRTKLAEIGKPPPLQVGGGCHECQVYFCNYLFINILKYRINIYISCVNKNNKITFVEIIFRIKSAKNTIPAKLKKVINRLKLSQKYFL